ncbi:MAG: AbrB/MazE/SpoVT family DNA-binding domain-containing protein [Candidatus Limnocylindrales bacterium]
MAKIYGKGQVTIPKAVRDEIGLAAGDRVIVEARDGEIVIRRPRGVLEFEPPQTRRERLSWPQARRAARDERSAERARHGES